MNSLFIDSRTENSNEKRINFHEHKSLLYDEIGTVDKVNEIGYGNKPSIMENQNYTQIEKEVISESYRHSKFSKLFNENSKTLEFGFSNKGTISKEMNEAEILKIMREEIRTHPASNKGSEFTNSNKNLLIRKESLQLESINIENQKNQTTATNMNNVPLGFLNGEEKKCNDILDEDSKINNYLKEGFEEDGFQFQNFLLLSHINNEQENEYLSNRDKDFNRFDGIEMKENDSEFDLSDSTIICYDKNLKRSHSFQFLSTAETIKSFKKNGRSYSENFEKCNDFNENIIDVFRKWSDNYKNTNGLVEKVKSEYETYDNHESENNSNSINLDVNIPHSFLKEDLNLAFGSYAFPEIQQPSFSKFPLEEIEMPKFKEFIKTSKNLFNMGTSQDFNISKYRNPHYSVIENHFYKHQLNQDASITDNLNESLINQGLKNYHTNTYLEGWLQKRSNNPLKKYNVKSILIKKRWVVLTEKHLIYYRNQYKAETKGGVNFELFYVTVKKRKNNTFAIHILGHCSKLKFKCNNNSELIEWIGKIVEVIQRNKHSDKCIIQSKEIPKYSFNHIISEKEFLQTCRSGDILLFKF